MFVLNSPDVQSSTCAVPKLVETGVAELSNVLHKIGVLPKKNQALAEAVDADIDKPLMF